MKLFKSKPERKPDTANYDLFVYRMKRIKGIANKYLDDAQLTSRPFPRKDNLVVTYDDLLHIWDIADLALCETPVE